MIFNEMSENGKYEIKQSKIKKFVMWSSWFEEAKKKAEEALKATSQVVSEVFLANVLSYYLGN